MDLHHSLLVAGDLVRVFEGMELPCDGYLTSAFEIKTDESAMTGETDPISKNTLEECVRLRNETIKAGERNMATTHTIPSPVLLSGTKVQNGEGTFVTIVVGDYSAIGKIRKTLKTEDQEVTPL